MVLLDDGAGPGPGTRVVVADAATTTATPARDPGGMILLPVEVAGGGQGPADEPATDLAEPADDEVDRSVGAAQSISE
jgi:hypothetical protein